MKNANRSLFSFTQIRDWSIWIGILVLTLTVRLYHISDPLGDWHSFRQADTASVTREYVKHGIDLLHPRYHDVSNIQSGKLNLEGWRMVEFPLLNGFTAHILKTWPSLDLVTTSRLVSVISFTLFTLCWMWLIRRIFGWPVAAVSGFVLAVLPYSIFFTRVILPEPFLLFWVGLAAVSLYKWGADWKQKYWSVFWSLSYVLTFALALLVKPMAIFFAPLFFAIWWFHFPIRQSAFKQWFAFLGMSGVSVFPLLAWRNWILQFPSGIPASDWLWNGNGIRLRPAWWRWLFADRFGRLMWGYWGAPIMFLGLVVGMPNFTFEKKKSVLVLMQKLWMWLEEWLRREGVVVLGWVGMLAYLVIFATGNVQHDYYQTILIPLVSLAWARAAVWFVQGGLKGVQRAARFGAIAFIFVLGWLFAWYEVRGNFQVNNPALTVVRDAVQKHVPEDALIIANYNGDTTLLFHTERRGWPIGFSIDEKIADGAQYYITTAQDDEANELMKKYVTLEKTDLFILIDLTQPLPTKPALTKKNL